MTQQNTNTYQHIPVHTNTYQHIKNTYFAVVVVGINIRPLQDTVFKRQIVMASLSGMKESNALQVVAMAEELKRVRQNKALVRRASTVPEKVRRVVRG